MKLLSVEALSSGETLSTNIRTCKGLTLLNHGLTLTDSYIARLKALGIYSVYVEDELFDDLEVNPTLKDETKAQLLESLNNLQKTILKGKTLDINSAKKMSKAINDEVSLSIAQPINLINTFAADYPVMLHCINVAVIVAALSIKAKIKPEIAENYICAALLHDITLKDMAEDVNADHAASATALMKQTASIGPTSYMAVAMHHELFDGSGMPKNLSGTMINEGARMLAIADMYDNLVFGLGGFKRLPLHQAIEYIAMESGKKLDPVLVNLFADSVSVYPTGATVLLNNGKEAVVINQNSGMPSRPVVRLLSQASGMHAEFNLLRENTLFVEKIYL